MIKKNLYRYLGRNGIITSSVLLENIDPIPMFELKAGDGKILTNGERREKIVTVFMDEVNDWREIDE